MIPAAEKCLLPIDACSWSEDDVPPRQRGVRFSWLYDFVAKIDSAIADMWRHFRSTQKQEARHRIKGGTDDPLHRGG